MAISSVQTRVHWPDDRYSDPIRYDRLCRLPPAATVGSRVHPYTRFATGVGLHVVCAAAEDDAMPAAVKRCFD